MKVEAVEYVDGSQKLIGKLVRDETKTGKQPTIILFHAFEGLAEFTINYAKNIAAKGFIVFAPDMYGNGETARDFDGCCKLYMPFTQDRELARRRAVLAYTTILKNPDVDANKIGAMGFCFGGMCMLELARSGENMRAGVGAHSILAKSTLPTHAIKASMLMLQGYQDPQVPPTELKAFAQEMDEADVDDWSIMFFGHAKHSFTDPATGSYDAVKEKEVGREYNEIAAKRTFQYAMDFFKEKLA
ncbi:MAG: dienelactone hydrolase family protein [Gammaproteobacteria bacterium]